jgi:hypothetical protein
MIPCLLGLFMDIRRIIKKALYTLTRERTQARTSSSSKPTRRSEMDIYFTHNFRAKANEWGLTEDHARHVFYEGDTVKENMKVVRYKGQDIGIYVFRDRDTNQPVITSIWKRQPPGKSAKTQR